MLRIHYTLLLTILFISSCKEKKASQVESYESEVIKIAEHVEQAFWKAEDKRIKEATKGKSKYTPWENFSKEHEVAIQGIHTEDVDPPIYTAVIRLHIPEIKDAYYEFHFQKKETSWRSTEAYMIGPKHQRNFYSDPYPGSKNLKEYFPAELEDLGAPIIIDPVTTNEGEN
ncbi:MAG: hypothetical protein ACSHX6_07065 [Akkermansiaceae bacterium]